MTTTLDFPATEVYYPESDGQPMAETDFQQIPLIYAIEALRYHFRHRSDVYVSGDLFIYYEEGNPSAVVAPDVFVVIGAQKRKRRSYFLWREPKAPDFVLEITSQKTRASDQGPKKGTYAYLGIPEYWQYDPTGDYLRPPLQGFRLVDGNYHPIAPLPDAAGLVYYSPVLDLELHLQDGEFFFYKPATRQRLLTYAEAEQARQQAEQARREAEERARGEAQARQAAEVRLAKLEARLRELGKSAGDD